MQTVAILPLTGDRGLAGAFNAQVLRRAFALERELRAEGKDVRWLVVGQEGRARRCASAATRSTRRGPASPTGRRTPTRRRSRTASPSCTSSERGRPRRRSSTTTSSRRSSSGSSSSDLLPIPSRLLEADDEERARAARSLGDFIYEPEPEQILERLLPVYVETEIYRALLESAASEQGARMTAMRNASKNAGELIDTPDARR